MQVSLPGTCKPASHRENYVGEALLRRLLSRTTQVGPKSSVLKDTPQDLIAEEMATWPRWPQVPSPLSWRGQDDRWNDGESCSEGGSPGARWPGLTVHEALGMSPQC